MKNLKVYKKCLIVVDMVNGFVREGGLADSYIEHTISYQQDLIHRYQQDEELIVFIKDCHEIDSVEHDRFGPIKHCIKGTKEAELIDEYQEYEQKDNVLTFEKNCTSFREAPGFIEAMNQAENIQEFDIVGCCTDICIANGVLSTMNYFDQVNRRVTVRLHPEGIETFGLPERRDQYSEAAYLLLEQQGAKVIRKEMK